MLDADFSIDLNELDVSTLELGRNHQHVEDLVVQDLEQGLVSTNDKLALLFENTTQYTGSRSFDGLRSRSLSDLGEGPNENYSEPARSKIVARLKSEFGDFLCTDSTYYEKERKLGTGNVNTLIAGVAAAIASNLGALGLEIGLITSFVVLFFRIAAKMGKKVICQSFA